MATVFDGLFTATELDTLDRFEIPTRTVAQRKSLAVAFPQYKSLIVRFNSVEAETKAQALAEAQAQAAEYASQTHFTVQWAGESISLPLGLLEYLGMSKASLDGNNDYNNTAQYPAMAEFKKSVDNTLALIHLGKGYDEKAAYAQQTRERIEASLTE